MNAPLKGSVGNLHVAISRGERGQRPTISITDSARLVLLDRIDLLNARARARVAGLAATEEEQMQLEWLLLDLAQKLAHEPIAHPAPADGGGAIVHETEPCAHPVRWSEVLDETRAQISRHAILPPHGAVALSLWVAASHCVEHLHYFGLMHIVSATRESGKTRTLELVGLLAARSWSVVSPTLATLFRVTESLRPTLILDEFDTLSREKLAELSPFLNEGVRRGGCIPRCSENAEGGGFDVQTFSVFGPKVIGSIGMGLSDATASRTIRITMVRASGEELTTLAPFRVDRAEKRWAGALRAKLGRAGLDDGPRLALLLDHAEEEDAPDEAAVPLPWGITGRQAQIWEPLIALADVAGGDWPALARAAATALSGAVGDGDSTDGGMRLLADLRQFFSESAAAFASSAEILAWLTSDEGRGWLEVTAGRPLSAHQLARMLKRFEIRTARLDGAGAGQGRARVWIAADFHPVWTRYLPASGEKNITGALPASVQSCRSVQSVPNPPDNGLCVDALDASDTMDAYRKSPPQIKKGRVRATFFDGTMTELSADDRDIVEMPLLFKSIEPLDA